ncbi:MAG TPA: Ada metal-binding domain-containing protein [Alphaproteobacteria bacterium]|nr:Ada metal-binding domain-containing protein [Alphaproteobacteria bacterium]
MIRARAYSPAMLDFATCDRARTTRDRRYDGRFFTGVVTTGIYCRPVCPVKPAQSRNVIFFPTAAAAEQAGFRPCLRCRPEAAPFSPAWRGSAATVSRAMRMIHGGFLDHHSVEQLALRLGIGRRHLDRLFYIHAGATPVGVAKTCRVQRAKRLLEDPGLSITEVAFAAGFSSVRRFNAVFLETYGRPPSSLRRRAARR